MPDLSNRPQLEADLQARLDAVQAGVRARLERLTGDPTPIVEDAERDRSEALFWPLLLAYLYAYNNLHGELGSPRLPSSKPADESPVADHPGRNGVDLPPADQQELVNAAQHADQRSREIARGMRQTDEKRIQRQAEKLADIRRNAAKQQPEPQAGQDVTPPGKSVEDAILAEVEDAIDDLTGAARTLRVAITETTAAISAGEHAVAARVSLELGWEIERFWQVETNELDNPDDRVCPICRPLHDQPSSVYGDVIGAPPAHIICRCWELYRVVSKPDDPPEDPPLSPAARLPLQPVPPAPLSAAAR